MWKENMDELERMFDELLEAAKELREAQKNYMADRGNDALGKIVGEKAEILDSVIKQCE